MSEVQNLVIDQGADFTINMELLDFNDDLIDTTGWTAISQLRKSYEASSYVSFTVTFDAGIMNLSMNAVLTATLVPGRYVYDVLITDSEDNTIRQVEGVVTVTPGVSRG